MGMTTMNADDRPTERSALAAWYGEALADQEESGLSMAAYAAKVGVTRATLYQWRRRLARDRSSDETATGLVRVRVDCAIEQEEEERLVGLIVRLPRGRSIVVPSGFDADDLVRVIEVLDAC